MEHPTRFLGVRAVVVPAMLCASVLVGCASAPRNAAEYCKVLDPESVMPTRSKDRQKGPDAIYLKHEVSHRVAPFAIFANNAYERGKGALLPLPAGWSQFCVDDGVVDCDASRPGRGLQAKIFTYRQQPGSAVPQKIVFAFRGTNSLLDWFHGNLFSGQYKRANAFVVHSLSQLEKRYPGVIEAMQKKSDGVEVVATGHSLGGGLGEHMAFCFSQLNVHASSLDPSPRNWKRTCEAESGDGFAPDLTYERFAKRPSEEEIEEIRRTHTQRVHQTMEVLSPLRHAFSSEGYPDETFHFLHGTLVSRHSVTALAMGLTKLSSCPIELTPGRRSDGSEEAAKTYQAVCASASAPLESPCFTQEELRARFAEATR
jgi:hypothetical protein